MNVARADRLVQRGRGKVGRYVGQSYEVFRLTNQTGQIVQGQPIIANFKAKMTHYTGADEIENANFGIETFQAVGDDRQLAIGDVLVGFGYGGDTTNYVVAGMRPLKHLILVRAEQNATITRPYDAASASDTMPSSGAVYSSQYANQGQFTEQALSLTSGSYSWGNSTAAVIPVGLQPHNRLREYPATGLPTELRREFFVAYVPHLNGTPLVENIVINCGNGDRYKAMQVYEGQFGLVGWNVILQKLEI